MLQDESEIEQESGDDDSEGEEEEDGKVKLVSKTSGKIKICIFCCMFLLFLYNIGN